MAKHVYTATTAVSFIFKLKKYNLQSQLITSLLHIIKGFGYRLKMTQQFDNYQQMFVYILKITFDLFPVMFN